MEKTRTIWKKMLLDTLNIWSPNYSLHQTSVFFLFVGRQREPCIFHLVPAGVPDNLSNCSIGNQTTSSLQVSVMTIVEFHSVADETQYSFVLK